MKRYLRLYLVFLISLALPFTGMAGVQTPVEPCPMQMSDMAAMTAMAQTMDMDVLPDCCQDMDSSAGHGKPCKTGQECKTASLLQVATTKPPVPLSASLAVSDTHDLPPEQSASGPWRPPRA